MRLWLCLNQMPKTITGIESIPIMLLTAQLQIFELLYALTGVHESRNRVTRTINVLLIVCSDQSSDQNATICLSLLACMAKAEVKSLVSACFEASPDLWVQSMQIPPASMELDRITVTKGVVVLVLVIKVELNLSYPELQLARLYLIAVHQRESDLFEPFFEVLDICILIK